MLGVRDAQASGICRLTTTIPAKIMVDKILTKVIILIKNSNKKDSGDKISILNSKLLSMTENATLQINSIILNNSINR